MIQFAQRSEPSFRFANELTTSEQTYQRTDFVQRCVVHAGFIGNTMPSDQNALLKALQNIQFVDWRAGFNSPMCIPPLLGPLSTRSLLDVLFGRIQLRFHFDGKAFIRLCTAEGVRAGFLKKRTTNRLRSTRGWRKGEVPLFDGRAIGYIVGDLTDVFGPSYLDEILFNWRTPSAMVRHMKQMEGELTDSAVSFTPRHPFSEADLESS